MTYNLNPGTNPHVSQGLADAGNYLTRICHGMSLSSGWWTNKPTGLDLREVINNPKDPLERLLGGAIVAQKLCLVHSETSEAMEGHRKGLMDDHLPNRSMIEVELADALIRICDLAGAMNLDLGGAVAEKMAYNAKRPDHKPENRAKEGGKAY
jgi:NTP pyrophosphatase (non-canonical NTP hydrolase)